MFKGALVPVIRSSTTSSSSTQCPRHLKRGLARDSPAISGSVGGPTVQSGTDRISRLADQDTCIVVELDHASIWPLQLLLCAHDNSVSDISTADLVCGGGRYTATAWARLGTEVALLLDDDDDALSWEESARGIFGGC